MKVGDEAPHFALKDGDGNEWSLVVLLFYPGDNTPVCTAQLCSVRDNWSDYQATGAEVVGISMDSVSSHKGFTDKHNLTLRLLADEKGEVAELYDAKSWLPGRSARAVIVIDKEGRIAYHKVQSLSIFRPKDDEVLTAIKAVQ
jgi:thioredoxin-dependent peroxiredoxin